MSVQVAIVAPQARAQGLTGWKTVAVLFFFSGASSLIFETLFTRLLSYTFGNTAYAASTVLAAFLGGLALGAYMIGKIADRFRPSLILYGALELAIGFYGLAVPAMFAGLTRVYVLLFHALQPEMALSTGVRFVLAAIVIVIPSALMGGTLPVLARAMASDRASFQSDLTRFYAFNTFGAAAGTLTSTYLLMPAWGVRGAIWAACGINGAIFLTTLFLFSSKQGRACEEGDTERDGVASFHATANEYDSGGDLEFSAGRRMRLLVLASAFLTGLITLVYEVIWTHALAFLVGNAVYAFGMMLFTFLCGLAIGAHFVSRLRPRPRTWAWALAVSQAFAGLVIILSLPLWNLVPGLFRHGVETARVLSLIAIGGPLVIRLIWIATTNLRTRWREAVFEFAFLTLLGTAGTLPLRTTNSYFATTEAFRFVIAFYLLIVPVVLLGMSFPCLFNLFLRSRTRPGNTVGSIYAVNTLGSIAGALLGGFVLLPLLGSYSALGIAATFNTLVGAAFFFLANKGMVLRKIAFAGAFATVALIALFQPLHWDMRGLSEGSYVYFRNGFVSDKLLYAREDVQGGLTSVVQTGATRILLTNGKFQGNNAGEVEAQIRFALIPALFTKAFDRSLVIGLGTGGSLRTVAAFPFRRIDVIELAPSVVDAARTWFGDVNGGVLDRDPRVHLSVADGRNHLLVRQDRFDLITIEVSSIWISGEADLYNKEFYQLCRSHLNDQGVLQQWVQVHHMRPKDFYTILNTAAQVFPHVAFFLGPEQGLLIASSSPLEVDYSQIHAWDNSPEIRELLKASGVHSMFSLLGEVVLFDESYRAAVSRFAQTGAMPPDLTSTDLNPYLEYQTPKGNVLPPELVIDRYFFSRLRPKLLPQDLVIQNLPGPEHLKFISGLALEDRGDYLAAKSAFAGIRGPLSTCAQSEMEWIGLVGKRMPGDPMPPFSYCRFGD